jgi:glycosyltransferase involved in cell wall biosynthesis
VANRVSSVSDILSRDATVPAGMPAAAPARFGRGPRILFLSAAPASAGHVYRVEHAIVALSARGWTASWLPLDDPGAAEAVNHADVVTLFRGRWGEQFAAVHEAARLAGIPLVVDLDDLLFDVGVMASGQVALLDYLDEAGRQSWIAAAASFRRGLSAADACVVTTQALATAAARVAPQVYVVPNGVDDRMIAAADRARASPKPSARDGYLRLGFAAGTRTHHRDFAAIAQPLAEILARRADARLVIVGHLDVGAVAELTPHTARIEVRPAVPFAALHEELARFDVNLAPLETGNAFCEAKSPIRCTAAALVGAPSVVAATAALVDVVVVGETGFVAADAAAWTAGCTALLDEPARRVAMGEAARRHVIARLGPDAHGETVARAYGMILAAGRQGGRYA